MSNCVCWECKLNQAIVLLSEVREELRRRDAVNMTVMVHGTTEPADIARIIAENIRKGRLAV